MRRPSLACQVEGCTADLASLRNYFQRQHICEEHAKADAIPSQHGGFLRFCQQCTKLEPLAAFEGTKRSCRTSLAKRHLRRSGGRRAPSNNDLYHAGRSYSSTDMEAPAASTGVYGAVSEPAGLGLGSIQRSLALATTGGTARTGGWGGGTTGGRDTPVSAASPQPDGPRSANTAPLQLAALLEAALPPLKSDPGGGFGGGSASAAMSALDFTQHQMGPAPIAIDIRGSSIMDPQPADGVLQASGNLSTHVPALRPMPSHPSTTHALPSVATLTGTGQLREPTGAAQNSFLQAVRSRGGGGASHSPAGGTPSAAATMLVARAGGDMAGAHSATDLLPYLASVLSSRASVELSSNAFRGGAAFGLPAGGAAEGGGAQQGDAANQPQVLLAELQQQQDLEQLLSALQMLQQLQGLIGGIVVSQLQQQLARVEAAALLDQQLLPLLAGIQARQAGGNANQPQHQGVQQQLDNILGQLGQLVGVLQAAPQPVAAQVLAAQQAGSQQRNLLQGHQSATHQMVAAHQQAQQQHVSQQPQQQQSGRLSAEPSSHLPAPGLLQPAQPGTATDGGAGAAAAAAAPGQQQADQASSQLHALLQRISPLLQTKL